MNSEGLTIPHSLDVYLKFAPKGAARALAVPSAAPVMTDALAAALLEECDAAAPDREAFVKYLHVCNFVVERNSEWHLAPPVREYLVGELSKDEAMTSRVHAALRRRARGADPGAAGLTTPAYLTWTLGEAYHTTVADRDKGLELYRHAYAEADTGQPSGRLWLLGRLAEEQQKRGWIPAEAVEPPFFRGMTAYREGRLDEAEEQFRRVSRSNQESAEVATALHLLGLIVYRRHYNLKEAEVFMRRSLRIQERLGDAPAQERVMLSLGRLLSTRNPRDAEGLLRGSLEIEEREGTRRGQVMVLQSLADLLKRRAGKTKEAFKEARQMLDRCLKLERELGNSHGQAKVMHNLANLIGKRDLKASEELLRDALKILRAGGDLHGQAQVLHTWGKLVGKHDLERGVKLLIESYEIRQRHFPDPYEEAQVLNSIGWMYLSHERWEEARDYLARATKSARHPRTLSSAYNGLSQIAEMADDDLDSAIAHMKQSVTYVRRTKRKEAIRNVEQRLRRLEAKAAGRGDHGRE